MRTRIAAEDGFGLIELIFAMLILNIGIFALIASFQSGTLAVSRAATNSSGSAVADKVMETFRDLKSCAIWLHGGTGVDNGGTGLPDGIPKSGSSSWYSTYQADTAAYASYVNGATQATYYNTTTPASTPQWVTENTAAIGHLNPAYCATGFPGPGTGTLATFAASTGIDPTKAVQKVTGPDHHTYPVFVYIVLLQTHGVLSGVNWTGDYVKVVTVVVRNPVTPSLVIARESSVFDPNIAP